MCVRVWGGEGEGGAEERNDENGKKKSESKHHPLTWSLSSARRNAAELSNARILTTTRNSSNKRRPFAPVTPNASAAMVAGCRGPRQR